MRTGCALAAAAVCLLLGSCDRRSGGGGELRTQQDSVAYVLGLNVANNLLRMDSTLRVDAFCRAVEDVYAGRPRMTPGEARAFYLRYVNVSLPEQAQAYEEQFLADFRKRNRSYRSERGLTYEITQGGDEERMPRNDRDTVWLRYVVRHVDGGTVESSYERADTLRSAVGDLMNGVKESVKLVGEGGRINAWIPSRLAYGAQGNEALGVGPNETLFYEIELVSLRRLGERR
ncbi:MAG: FKBP-type peptidyl-prolyl cis-trans isomerase [Alistipes sp.]|nr:FKBP-type peptidyl-prolyl cis-trans isomerase [Alistipes sp.]